MAGDVRAIYERYKPWILRYRGGAPAGMIAAIISHESSGDPNVMGDPNLGEVGLMQVARDYTNSVGVPLEVRTNPEANIFLGSLDLQLRAIVMRPYAPLGSSDSWKLTRLTAAVGAAGTRRLIEAATGNNPGRYRGQVFDRVCAWANATGAMQLSSGQPAEKVVTRINAVQDQWDVGQRISGSYGPPEKIPAPKGLTYRVPASAAPYLSSPLTGKLLVLGTIVGFGAAIYYAATR